MFEYSKEHIWSIVGLLVLDVAISMIGIGSTVASKYVIDLATASEGIITGFIIMVLLTVLNILLGVFSSIFDTIINEKYTFSIRIKLYASILKTKWPKLSAYHSGDLITRMTSDVNAVTNGITSVVPSIITLLIKLITAFVVLYHYDSRLALFALISGPIAVFASIYLGAKLRTLQ